MNSKVRFDVFCRALNKWYNEMHQSGELDRRSAYRNYLNNLYDFSWLDSWLDEVQQENAA